MIISQNRLTRMIEDQRAMFPGERLLVDEVCLATGHDPAEGVKHNFRAASYPLDDAAMLHDSRALNPCNVFCKDCWTLATIHRYGRPFIDPTGKLVRRCLNDGTNRRHTSDSRERCTDKHVLLKRHQLERGINRFRSQMSDPDAQLVRERERQESRLTTNERPSEFVPIGTNEVRTRTLADGRIERTLSRPGALFARREVIDPYTERLRRDTPAHTRADCGGCAGYYDRNGRLVRHRALSATELL